MYSELSVYRELYMYRELSVNIIYIYIFICMESSQYDAVNVTDMDGSFSSPPRSPLAALHKAVALRHLAIQEKIDIYK